MDQIEGYTPPMLEIYYKMIEQKELEREISNSKKLKRKKRTKLKISRKRIKKTKKTGKLNYFY